MNHISTLIKKEFIEAIRDRSLGTSLFSTLLFTGIFLFTTREKPTYLINTFIPYIPLIIGLTVGFSLSNSIVKEKKEGIIETILCSPIKLKELWLGKTLSISTISAAITTLTTHIILILNNYEPNHITIFYTLFTVPLFILACIGLLSLIYFYLGMKQIQTINYILFISIFLILFTILKIDITPEITWKTTSIITSFSATTLTITSYMINHTNIEKIVLTAE